MNDTTMTIRIPKSLKIRFDNQIKKDLLEAIQANEDTSKITQSSILRALINLYCKEALK